MAPNALKGLTLALCLALTLALSDIQCGQCDRSSCDDVGSCPMGLVMDGCGCCQVCARGLGQRCDLPNMPSKYGACGEYLKCTARTDIGESDETTCICDEEGPVCGSDGVTYQSLCHLLQKSSQNPDLFVSIRGSCKSVPKINTRPEDKVRPIGSILVLDCEVQGYPVPEISWELHRHDGSSIKLPSDDPSIAVQVRGGPEAYMVTGWVQIMRISQNTAGIYTCVAKNEEGETRASATISLQSDVGLEESRNEI